MKNRRLLLPLFTIILMISGCGLFNNEQNEVEACSEQLFKEIRLEKALDISIWYNIKYNNEQKLNEKEVQKQRKRIEETHEKFLDSLKDFQISSVSKSNHMPWIAMIVNGEEPLSFICSNKLVLEVSKTELGSTY